MEIALVTEGTYPYQHGGVSVWCDQLVRGLAPHRFQLYAITGSGMERSAWDLPDNVSGLVPIPLWGPSPAVPRNPDGIRALHAAFARVVISLYRPHGDNSFDDALHELFELTQVLPLEAVTRSTEALEVVLAAMGAHLQGARSATAPAPAPTIADAATALELLEHQLRPLSMPPPRVDLCHASSNGLAALTGLGAKWANNTPFVLTEHGIYLRERYLAFGPGSYSHAVRVMLLQFFKKLTSAAYHVADAIAPGSEYNRQWEEINGAPPERIRPIYNGVDASGFPIAPREPDAPTLTWVGRVDPLKDVETLIRAFAKVHEAMPDARLRIFGGTPTGNEAYADRCHALHAQLGLGDSATFEGRVPSVVDAYHAGHVVVLTSISEGFPYSLIEAMAAGRPTVSTNVGGISEAAGDAGFLVPPRNPEAFADACLILLSDPELRRTMGQAARKRALSLFTVEQCLLLYGDLYREVSGLPVSASMVHHDLQLLEAAGGDDGAAPATPGRGAEVADPGGPPVPAHQPRMTAAGADLVTAPDRR